ncbi:hypothetical protein A9X02_01310 [Mycobacterium malmoense]|nr:hypothetical protein A5644_14710 [Mycobacterium intracellulare subsp. yongonense]OCB54750.1 hypothetical protein A9X02_01310 [Mycobacterium malmoense]
MPVEGGMQKVMTVQRVISLAFDPAAGVVAGVAIARGAAQYPPAPAGGDLAEFLDIDMHQIPTPQ